MKRSIKIRKSDLVVFTLSFCITVGALSIYDKVRNPEVNTPESVQTFLSDIQIPEHTSLRVKELQQYVRNFVVDIPDGTAGMIAFMGLPWPRNRTGIFSVDEDFCCDEKKLEMGVTIKPSGNIDKVLIKSLRFIFLK